MAYRVAGRSALTTAAIDEPGAVLWNPHATKAIYVTEIWATKTAATADSHALVRTTTRGTAGSTVTPDADNADDRLAAPISGALLDLGDFTALPTVAGPYMARSNLPAAIGAGFIWVFAGRGITVPAGTGLAVTTPVAVAMQATDFTFVWDE